MPAAVPLAYPVRKDPDMTGIRHETRQSCSRGRTAGPWARPGRSGAGIVAPLFISPLGACTSNPGDESPERPSLTFADCGDLFDGRSAETKIPAERLSR